ncbi:MAG: hypothetical protein KatS3mg108_2572 [Isosphaeraceae bacterium]|jgi:hypothetical protein|nr:MAG: hypothetical protein KatS3mg108_2572 [Isosphaeraceae bacterium]
MSPPPNSSPPHGDAYESAFIRERMPALAEFRSGIDASFPMLEHELSKGVRRAGRALVDMLAAELGVGRAVGRRGPGVAVRAARPGGFHAARATPWADRG